MEVYFGPAPNENTESEEKRREDEIKESKGDDCLDKEIIKCLSTTIHDLLEYIKLLKEDNKKLMEQLKLNEMEMQNTWKNLTKK